MGAPLDLIGQRFHKLLVIARIPSTPEHPFVQWRCQCDCGSIKNYRTGELRSGRTYSCGCYRKQISDRIIAQPNTEKLGMVNDTNVSRINSAKPQRNNKLNMRGVSMDRRGRYIAFIYFKKTRTYLGSFSTAEEAKAAYDEAWKERVNDAQQECIELANPWQGKKVIDISGQRFGKLIAVSQVSDGKWECKCDCGNVCTVSSISLISGATRSCGCLKKCIAPEDLSGRKFGRLKAISYEGNRKWKCLCDCGKECLVSASHLKNGHTRSCGCLRHKVKE